MSNNPQNIPDVINSNSIRSYVHFLAQNHHSTEDIAHRLNSIMKLSEWAYHRDKIPYTDYQQIKDEIDNFEATKVDTMRLKASNDISEIPLHHLHTQAKQKVKIAPAKQDILAQFMRKVRPSILSSKHSPLDSVQKMGGGNIASSKSVPFVYISVAFLLVIASVLGYGIYDRFFKRASVSLAYPSVPTVADRFLSFQGRLTDSLGNPIVASTNMRFRLYDADSGGSTLYDSGTCSISPDQDGIHNVLIGEDCGSGIGSSVFTENTDIWLGVTVGADSEMTPRQRIANVPYAMNSETIQGLPLGRTASTVPYINDGGDLLIAAATPQVGSTYASETFLVSSANAVTLQSAGSGDVTLTATESGTIRFATGGSQHGVITNGGLFGFGTTGPDAKLDVLSTAGEQLRLSYADGSAYTSFTTNTSGDLTVAPSGGNINITGNIATSGDLAVNGDDITADGALTLNSASYVRIGDTGTPGTANGDDDLYVEGDLEVDGATLLDGNLTIGDASGDTTTVNSAAWTFANDTTIALSGGVNGLNIDSNTLSIDAANDRIGIGTAAPDAAWLDIAAATTTKAQLNLTTSGGTNVSSPNSGDLWWNGTELYFYNGSTNTDLLAGSTGASTFLDLTDTPSSYTAGSILFTSGSAVTEDNANLFWDDSTNRLGIGTNSPDSQLTITKANTGSDINAANAHFLLDNSSSTGQNIFGFRINGSVLGGVRGDYQGNFNWHATGPQGHQFYTSLNTSSPQVSIGSNGLLIGGIAGEVSTNKLDVEGSAAIGTSYADAVSAPTNGLIVEGNVGIGDSSPDAKLNVLSTTEQLRLDYDDSNYASFTVNSGGDLTIAPTGSDTNITGNLTTSGNTTLGDASGDTVTTNAAAWTFTNDTTVALSGGVDGLNFDSNTLSIDATNDKIGIGTAAPDGKLHVTGAAVGKALAIFNETGDQDIIAASASGNTRFRVANDGTIYGGYLLDISNTAYGIDPAGTSNFGGYSLKVTGGALLAYDSGSVGIGATSPTGKLQVVGDETRFGDAGSVDFATGDGDVYIEDALEVDGTLYAGSFDTTFTPGSIVFAGASGVLAEDNTNFFWDDSSNELGLGDTTPDAFLDITGTTEQLRLSYETGDTNYASFTLSSGGDLTIAPTGGDFSVTGNADVSGGLNVGSANQFVVSSTGGVGMTRSLSGDTQSAGYDNNYTYSGALTGSRNHYGIGTTMTSNIDATGQGASFYSNSNFFTNNTTAGSIGYTGNWTYMNNNAAGASVNFTGYRADSVNGSTGTLSTAINFQSLVTNASSGTISDAFGFRAHSPSNASGTISNIYGIHIADQSVGTNSNAYGIVIENQSGASGIAAGLYIADADDYSLQLASTDGDAASGITFGTDTNLYRSGANTLHTDDNFDLDGSITLDGDLAVNGDDITADGALTLNSASYVRIGDSGTPGSANGDDDLYVEGDLEIDGVLYTDGGIDTALTAGSVVFAGTNGVLTQDNSNFFWDDSNNRLGIGTSSPSYHFHSEQAVAAPTTNIRAIYGRVNNSTAGLSGTEIAGIEGRAENNFVSGTDNYSYVGVKAVAANNTTIGTASEIAGLYAYSQVSSAGSISNVYAGRFRNAASAGTVGNAFGLYVDHAGGSTITNNYGLYIADPTSSTITSNYGIYIAAQTLGSTDVGLYIADAGTYSLQLASTDGDAASGITFGTDTNLYRSAAGSLTTNGDLVIAGGDLTGAASAAIDLGEAVSGDVYVNTDVLVGGTSETLSNSGFSLSGNDMFIADTLGVEGSVYTDGSFIAGATLTLSDAAITESGDLNFQPNGDTDDYLYMNTTTDVPGLFWEGIAATDPGIYVSGTELGYRDESDSWVSFDSLAAGAWTDGGSYVYTTNGEVLNLGGLTGVAYHAISDSGTTSHSLASDDDLYVEGDFEVDGTLWADGAVTAAGNITTSGDLAVNGDDITSDGTLVIDATTDIWLDADGADVLLRDGGSTYATFTNSSNDLTVDAAGGQLIVANGDTLNIGGLTGVAYNAISDSGTTSRSLASDDDLYVEGDFEVDTTAHFDGNINIGNASGDTVTVQSSAWTFANDTTIALSGGLNGINFDSNTLSIDAASDRVGIGTAAPAVTLDVVGSGDFSGGLNVASSNHFNIDSSGNVGIGVTADSEAGVSMTKTVDASTIGAGGYALYESNLTLSGFASGTDVVNGTYTSVTSTASDGGGSMTYRGDYTNVNIDSQIIDGSINIYGEYTNVVNDTNGTAIAYGSYVNMTNYGTAGYAYYALGQPGTGSTGFVHYGYNSAVSVGATSSFSSASHFNASTPSITAGGAITNLYGMYVNDQAVTGVTNAYGLYVANQSGASSANVGIYIADADTYSLQLASTDGNAASGITFGTDTNLYRNGANVLHTDDSFDIDGNLTTDGNTTLGNASGDTVTANAAAWTFANDTTVALSGGVNGLNFDSNTLSVDATNDRIGIGTAAPDGKLHVTGASVGKALAVFNETGDQNILVASSSGTGRFAIGNNGDFSKLGAHGVNAIGDQGSIAPNGSFEVNADGDAAPDSWIHVTGGHTSTITSGTDAWHGDYYLSINSEGSTNRIITTCFPVAENTSGIGSGYTVAGYFKGPTTTNPHAQIGLIAYASRSDCESQTGGSDRAAANISTTTSWAQATGTSNTTTGDQWARGYIDNINTSGRDLDVDGFRVEKSALTAGLDLAETYPAAITDKIQVGEIVAFSNSSEIQSGADVKNVTRTVSPYDKLAFGVIATKPGLVLDDSKQYEKVQVALKGRVPVLVTTENGPIRVGDPITASSKPGVGMKATRSGRIIGYAMTEWTHPDPKKVDQVTVFVNPETYVDLSVLTDMQNKLQNLPTTITSGTAALASLTTSTLESTSLSAQNLLAQTAKIATATIDSLIVDRILALEITARSLIADRITAQEVVTTTLNSDTIETSTASVAGELAAKSISAETVAADTVTAKDASISGTLSADIVDAQNIRELRERLERIATQESPATVSPEQLEQEVAEIQTHIAQLTNSPTSTVAKTDTYQILNDSIPVESETYETLLGTTAAAANLETLTVTGTASMSTLAVADAFSAGDVFIQGNSLISLVSELKLSALEQVDIMNGAVVIAHDGTITAKGEVIAEKGIRTNTIQPLADGSDVTIQLQNGTNSDIVGAEVSPAAVKVQTATGTDVASINADGAAQFSTLSLSTYKEATSSAVIIAARDNYRQTGLYAPAIQTNASASGNGILPAGENDILIFNSKITPNTIVNLTATSTTQNQSLYVDKIEICSDNTDELCRPYFRVALDRPINSDVTFNWLLVN